jgi:signal transduction histidine kinase
MSSRTLEREQLERLLEVGRGLVAELDLDGVLRLVIEAARDLTGARYAALGVLDGEKQALERFVYVGIDEEQRRRIGPLPRGHGLLGELIRDPRALRLARISDHPRSYGFPAEHPEMVTFLGSPVMIRGEVYGNLYLTEKPDGAEFDERDQELVAVLAEWAAIAIENARAHTSGETRRMELERAVRGLEATVGLSREVGVEADLDRVLELVVKRGRALIDAGTCVVLLIEHDSLRIAAAAGDAPAGIVGEQLPAGESLAADVLRAGVARRASAESLRPFARLGLRASAGLLAPLRFRGRNVGLLAAFDRIGEDPEFSGDDELLLASFAISAGSAVAATLALENEKLQLSITASEQERRRWARELHDETLQELSALRVLLDSAREVDSVESMAGALDGASEQVGRVIEGLQGLITELRPAALDELGAGAALEALADRLRDRGEVEIDLDLDLAYASGRAAERLDPELEVTIYRIVQEGLNNVIKHARATRAQVVVEETDSRIRIVVEDDGRGFQATTATTGGFGLSGMRERVALAGGELRVEPAERGGTRLNAVLPVTRADARRNGPSADGR